MNIICDECAELGIFDSELFDTGTHGQDFCDLSGIKRTLTIQDELGLEGIDIILEPLDHAVESSLGRVGYVGENGVVEVVIYGFEYFGH